MPRDVSHERRLTVIRKRTKAPTHLLEGLELRLAESPSELEAAFRLAYEAYLEAGFTALSPERLRVTKYHALPTTSVVVSTLNGEVIATATTIQDSALGLPSDAAFDLSRLRRDGARLVEISSLAVDKRYRSQEGAVIFPLFRYVLEYCRENLRADQLIIGVNPCHADFYEAILVFERWEDGAREGYAFANGNPVVGANLDLHRVSARFEAAVERIPEFASVARYFIDVPFQLQLPSLPYFVGWHSILDVDLLENFFSRRTGILSSLSAREGLFVAHQYEPSRVSHLIPHASESDPFPARAERRYPVACQARAGATRFEVHNVSLGGLKLATTEPLTRGMRLDLEIQAGRSAILAVSGQTTGPVGEGCWGVRLDRQGSGWNAFVDYLRQMALREPAEMGFTD